MKLKVLKGARVLMSTDGNNTLFIDTGTEIVPVTSAAAAPVNGEDGEDGEDGGYYTPNVNTTTGYVTWTPSKTTMPAIAPANIRGPQGPAGANGANGTNGRGVVSIALTADATGAVTGGTVTYTDNTTGAITVSQATV